MKKLTALLFFILPALCPAQDETGIIATGAKVEKLADGFGFTEGPVADNTGNVYFTDQPNDRIWKWTTDEKLVLFREGTGRANGLYFDNGGRLLACSDMDNEVWSFDTKTSEHRVVLGDFQGKKLNGPNDLWVDSRGGVYFTDPLYPRNYWKRNPKTQQPGEYVYYLSPDGKTVVPVATDLEKPNGIIGSPDGGRLYVADIKANKTYVYEMAADGALKNKKLFASLGSDGMTVDSRGNVYLTGKGVHVFNSSGEKIAHIPVNARWTANVCFGGKDGKTLFITASQYLYALRMNVEGKKPKKK